ncbi:D-2-hydroxyacid dehydrogenase family protein [Ramlibacter sp. MMS24-I3-19]|uniref:D-2-hydroxyacid dehydrogenase family protein n=1 Tax=Ramlibacter sp. MMS24-I3-19 TaxID=3416606 RepID=UPI003D05DE0A
MRVTILDDYQDCVRTLRAFTLLQGHEVTVLHEAFPDRQELARKLADAEALVLIRERTRVDRELIDRLPRLRMISQIGKVAPHIDLQACSERGITVCQGEGTGAATAELTWALVLASRRHIVDEANRLRAGAWQGSLGQQLRGSQLGIWSYGRIGRQVAGYGKAFGMRVVVWGGAASRAAAVQDGFEVAASRQAFFAESDVVSLHLRLGPDTRGAVTAADLLAMKPSALLVNTSRAELIAPGALVDALRAGRPGFAAVDVFEREPVLGATDPLLQLPNALCTPHLGYVERDNYERYFGIAFDNINAFAKGQPRNVVAAQRTES